MNISVIIVCLYLPDELSFTHITRELAERKCHPHSLTGSAFHRDIRSARRIVPDEDDGEVWLGRGFRDFFTDVFVNGLRDRASIEKHERSGQKLSRG